MNKTTKPTVTKVRTRSNLVPKTFKATVTLSDGGIIRLDRVYQFNGETRLVSTLRQLGILDIREQRLARNQNGSVNYTGK